MLFERKKKCKDETTTKQKTKKKTKTKETYINLHQKISNERKDKRRRKESHKSITVCALVFSADHYLMRNMIYESPGTQQK